MATLHAAIVVERGSGDRFEFTVSPACDAGEALSRAESICRIQQIDYRAITVRPATPAERDFADECARKRREN